MTLPAGWDRAALADLVGRDGFITDGDWVESKDQDPDGEVRLTQLADVGDGNFRDRLSRFMSRTRATELQCTYLSPGDVLIARMPDPLGRACVFPPISQPCVSVVDVCIVRTGNPGVDPRWLMYAVNAPEMRSRIEAQQKGTTRKRISKSRLLELEFPLPPLAEQRRIVDALETQFTRLDAAVATLERVRANLKRYRAAVLQAAVEGRLTPIGSTARNWATVPLSEVGSCVTGATPPTATTANYGTAVPFVKPPDLGLARDVRHTGSSLSPLGATVARVLPPGSVMVTCIGVLGKTGIARVPCATNQQINSVIPDPTRCVPRYLLWALSAPSIQKCLHSLASATTLPIVNKGRFETLAVPLPSLELQRRIVEEIERRMSLADAALANVDVVLTRTARLRQSLLQLAFAGRLVPQDPADEPASVLLDRIRRDRAAAAAPAKRKTSRSRS